MTADEFRAGRLTLGLSQQSLADLMGYGSRSRVYEIEAGRRIPGPAAARLLQAYLNGYRPDDWPDGVDGAA